MVRNSAHPLGPYPLLIACLLLLGLLIVRARYASLEPSDQPEATRIVPGLTEQSVQPGPAANALRSASPLPVCDGVAHSVESPDVTSQIAFDPRDLVPREAELHWAKEPQPVDLAALDRLTVPGVRVLPAGQLADPVRAYSGIPAAPTFPVDFTGQFLPRSVMDERTLNKDSTQLVPGDHPPKKTMVTLPDPKKLDQVWPTATTLRTQLERLAVTPASPWARQILQHLDALETVRELGSSEAQRLLEQLDALANQIPFEVDLHDPHAREWLSQFSRARYGLQRRLIVWKGVARAVREEPTWRVSYTPSSVQRELRHVEELLPDEGEAGRWRKYLLLDALSTSLSDPATDEQTRSALARQILHRMSSDRLTEEQRRFVAQPILAQLNEQLRLWAYQPPDYRLLLEAVEAWESGQPEAAAVLAEQWQVIACSPWEQTTQLARQIDQHYRNANIRVAISGELINRLLPPLHTEEEEVQDRILGTPVVGRSRTVTRLFVELIPDRMRWRLGLEASGHVQSQTWAERGSVSLLTHGATRYRARKLLTIDRHGIFAHRTETEAENSAELADVSTQFDGLPLLGSLLRSIARRSHQGKLPQANAEVEQKVSARVAQRLDEEVANRIYTLEKQYRERLLSPLAHLNLHLTTLDMQTTTQRLIARYRLAADHQLAAHTPRPIAPSDSLLSVQLHESLANNILEQLHLAGRRARLSDLYREITALFGKQIDPPEDLPDNILVHFAEEQPVRVRFDEGRVFLTLNFAELRSGRNSWYDFQVHTAYTPKVVERKILLVREDPIELRGTLSFTDRLPLRAIFTALLARERAIPLLDPKITQHERLADTHVSQLVSVDGWIGLAISPQPKTAQRPSPVRVSLSDEPPARGSRSQKIR